MGRMLEWIAVALMLATAAGITLWMAGAIYYDVCRVGKGSRWIARGWIVMVLVSFVSWHPVWQPFIALLGIFSLFLIWWLRLRASHDRDWHPSMAKLPRAVIEQDSITIENIRNFDYRSLDDFTERYETRTYHLSNLQGVDVIFFVWEISWMGHPVLVFDFGPDGHICMSIEMRYQKGESYSILRSLYRQNEMIFLAADERDVILRRTKFSQNQKAYLYRMNVEAKELRDVFIDYVNEINRVYETPRWYNVIFWNCTTSFYRLRSTRFRIDWRVIANGRLDEALYKDGRIDRTLSYEQLRQFAYLNDVANAAPEEGFSDTIRHELQKRRANAGIPQM
jgi:hypothetical protein